jgi:glycosyltransferase involved in cell wall biosynthesis
MKKIAFIGIKGLPSRAGADRVVEAIVARLDKSAYEISVYGSTGAIPKGTRMEGLRLVRVPTLHGKYLRPISLIILSAIHALCFGNYDVVHVHNVEACFVLPILRLRFKTISTSHAAPHRLKKWGRLARTLMRLTELPFSALSNGMTAVSADLASDYGRRYGKLIHHVPNGVDSGLRNTAENGRISGVDVTDSPSREYILFAVARIMPEKGCHLLLEAWAGIKEDIDLWIMGDLSQIPAYGQKLKNMADHRVRFIPLISSKDELFRVFRRCRLFVFASADESMSMTLLEVASLGIPLVCSDIPANKDILPEKTLFFRSGDAGNLQEKMSWALDHPGVMRDLASQARSWVTARYDWDAIVPRYEALYESVCPAWYESERPRESRAPGAKP